MDFKLILGYKCNMKCAYCYQIKAHSSKKDMSYKIINKFIERFNKLDGTHSINFFGGEPLLYVDKIKYIMDRIDKKHNISISTNGSLRGEFYELEKYWGSSISNLLSNKEHKDFTKLNDLSGFRYVVTKENINSLTDEILEFLAKHYKDKLHFKYDLSKKWEYQDVKKMEEIQKVLQKYLGQSYRIDMPINYNHISKCFDNNSCFINYNGDYLACHRLENTSIGNILTDDFICCRNSECIYDRQNKEIENLYSFGKYEYKGYSIFHSCNS